MTIQAGHHAGEHHVFSLNGAVDPNGHLTHPLQIRSEPISSLARRLRGHAVAALENVPLWQERDISHSSAERVLLPSCSAMLHFMLREMTAVVAGLVAYPKTMLRNMTTYGGVIFSQQVLLALVAAGLSREEAYALVQHHAHQA